MSERETLVRVAVYHHSGDALEDVAVTLTDLASGTTADRALVFDPGRGGYVARGVPAGGYVLAVRSPRYDPDRRAVTVDEAGLDTIVVLGEPKLPFLFRGQVRVPFEPHPGMVGVALAPGPGKPVLQGLLDEAGRLGLTSVAVDEWVRREGILLFRSTDGKRDDGTLITRLRSLDGVAAAGAVVRLDGDAVSFLTGEVIAKFAEKTPVSVVTDLVESHGFALVGPVPPAEGTFLLRFRQPATYALLEAAAGLAEHDEVVWAEPNLVSTAVDDQQQQQPADFLYPAQWHLPAAGCPGAWQLTATHAGCDQQYGSPDLHIAVIDTGVDLGNADFIGAVSDGTSKVAGAFDFQNLIPGNDDRPGGHGTCCAGVCTAMTAAGEGCVGAAPNCRLIAVRRPSPGTELAYGDMYLWAGGLGAGITTTGFPAALPHGADIITSSFGYSAGLPISGRMKDVFDALTTSGRDGDGVLLFFSAGNNGRDLTLLRPWAAYTRTLAVAASTLRDDGVTEVRAAYSNHGGAGVVDVCAPSSSTLTADYDPPAEHAILTATDLTSADLLPDVPSQGATVTATAADAAAAAVSISVDSSAGFTAGDALVIGAPGTGGMEFTAVTAVPDATHLSVGRLRRGHSAGTAVLAGPATARSDFGGTSSAAPLAAGIAALVLTVRPDLTWAQVRDVLRESAVHIDEGNTDAIGRWRDENGRAATDPGFTGAFYSRWYGFGRIDAAAAVTAALALP
ncbi:S8 family serine peptidase [Actinoplanes sp. NPDC023714]|uniref:S8 family serine peptidase n=1 Tax=Actinoplanes sp. NPDC023714 TaxID=3154322 RepID=UPI0033F993B2